MINFLKINLTRAFKISTVGLTMGALAGLASLLTGDDMQAIAALSALIFWVIAVLPTLILLVLVKNDFYDRQEALYVSPVSAYGRLIFTNVIGAIGASIFFVVLATSAPAFFKNLDAATLRQSLQQHIGLLGLGIVLAGAVIGAALVAAWAHRRATA